MNEIKETTIDKTLDGMRDMLYSYLNAMNRAYLEQDKLTVSMGFDVSPHKDGVVVNYRLSFVESKVKDSDSIIIDDKQQKLPFDDPAIKAAKSFADSVPNGTVVSLESGDRKVTLMRE